MKKENFDITKFADSKFNEKDVKNAYLTNLKYFICVKKNQRI
jgi:hypothetical protein